MAGILVVDDEAPVRQLIGEWLKRAGYEYREAENAEAALAALKAEPAGVVFSDVQMPGQDGLWMTKQIRNTYPTTAVILATSVSTVPPQISMQHGVVNYLVKPFNQKKLLEALKMALDWHKDAVEKGAPKHSADELENWLNSLDN